MWERFVPASQATPKAAAQAVQSPTSMTIIFETEGGALLLHSSRRSIRMTQNIIRSVGRMLPWPAAG